RGRLKDDLQLVRALGAGFHWTRQSYLYIGRSQPFTPSVARLTDAAQAGGEVAPHRRVVAQARLGGERAAGGERAGERGFDGAFERRDAGGEVQVRIRRAPVVAPDGEGHLTDDVPGVDPGVEHVQRGAGQ